MGLMDWVNDDEDGGGDPSIEGMIKRDDELVIWISPVAALG